MSSYTIYVLEMQAEIQRLGSELAEARREIQSLIESIWRAEYRREAPQWKPLPDLVGMITQMDNMYAGVREQRDQARWDKVEARDKALDEAADACEAHMKQFLDDNDVRKMWPATQARNDVYAGIIRALKSPKPQEATMSEGVGG